MDRFADAVLVSAIGFTVWWVWAAVMMLIVISRQGTMKYPMFIVWLLTLILWMLWVVVR